MEGMRAARRRGWLRGPRLRRLLLAPPLFGLRVWSRFYLMLAQSQPRQMSALSSLTRTWRDTQACLGEYGGDDNREQTLTAK